MANGYKALARKTVHRECSLSDRPFESIAIDVRSRLFRHIRLTCTKRRVWRKIRCVLGLLLHGKEHETQIVLDEALGVMTAETELLSVKRAIYVLCSETRCPLRESTKILARQAESARARDQLDSCIGRCTPLDISTLLQCHIAFERYLISHIEPICLMYNQSLPKTHECLTPTRDDYFESDRLCAVLDVDAVLSEDMDCVALFGTRVMIVSVCAKTSYVALSDVLQTFESHDRDDLVNKCCLMGTDYNLGMKRVNVRQIEPEEASAMVAQCMSMQSIDLDMLRHLFLLDVVL